MRNPGIWRDLGVCLSLVNLLYLGVWTMTLPLDAPQTYYLPGPAPRAAFFLRPVGVCLTAALVLLAAGRAVRALGRAGLRRLARATFLVLTLCALNAVRHLVPSLSGDRAAVAMGRPGFVMATILVIALAGLVIARWSRRAVQAASVLLLLTLPFFVVVVTRAVSNAVACRSLDDGRFEPRAYRGPSPRQQSSAQARVVVVIFDEMDQRRLPPASGDMALPAIEALQETSLWSARASAPSELTMQAMPALLSGQRVESIYPSAPDELELTITGSSSTVGWSTLPNPFREVNSLGQKAALVGWYHPYCRLFGQDLASCASFSHVPDPDIGFARDLLRQAVLVGETIPGVARFELPDRLDLPRPPLVPPKWHVRQYLGTHEAALQLVGDPRYTLVFLHYPVPHAPFIYSQTEKTTQAETTSYDDNLVLADRSLAELRARMVSDGVWGDSTLILTSDHGWRKLPGPSLSVPFVLKLAGQTSSFHYDRPLETILLSSLLTELLNGRLKEIEAVVRWLDRQSNAGVAPASAEGSTPRQGGDKEPAYSALS